MLISIPQLILPVLLYWLGSKYGNANIGLAIVAAVGILGLSFKRKGISQIEKSINQKYATIAAYKQKRLISN
jgi:hypothetical protein